MTVNNLNDLMTWLNNKFNLGLPMLPASPYEGWPTALVALWKMAVQFVAGSPVQADVKIDGSWTMDVPGGAKVTLGDLQVHIIETNS